LKSDVGSSGHILTDNVDELFTKHTKSDPTRRNVS